jgi:acyl-CoA synthetase (AMP-forming)/AMP-acid ligase II
VNLAQKILTELSNEPERPFIYELSDDADVVRVVTRADLLCEAAAWQTQIAEAGLVPGEAIGLSPARNSSLPALHLAALAAGLPIVPINPTLSDREKQILLAEANLKRVIVDPIETPALISGAVPIVAKRDDSDVAMILYTSGTTGKPKSVPLSHRNLTYDLETLEKAWRRSRTDRLLHLLPAHHFHGLVLAAYGSLLCGCEMYLLPRFDARTALDCIARHDISLVMGVPTMYARMVDAARTSDDLSGLRLALSGSAPLDPTAWKRFYDRFGVALIERYGLTETGIVTTNPIGAAKPASVGKPIEGTRIEILADDTLHAAGGSASTPRGEICIAGPSVTAGYGNAPEANREAFRFGMFRSGDLGYFDEQGYLFIDGRLKELIIVGGSNVIPGEVERALAEVPGVRELAATGLPDTDLGEVVAVFVALRPDAVADVVRKNLEGAAEKGLAGYKRPRLYEFVEELPRNAMGKIDRAKLAAG